MIMLVMLVLILLPGLGILLWGIALRSWLLMCLGGVLMFPAVAVFVIELITPRCEWNPIIFSDADVIGTYVDGGDTVTFAADGTFSYRLSSSLGNGTWRHGADDRWNLYLSGDTTITSMHLIRELEEDFRGELHLIPRPIVPRNEWDWDWGLSKVRGKVKP